MAFIKLKKLNSQKKFTRNKTENKNEVKKGEKRPKVSTKNLYGNEEKLKSLHQRKKVALHAIYKQINKSRHFLNVQNPT